MTTDTVTTITGILAVVAAGVAQFLPPDMGALVKVVVQGISLIAGAIFAYYVNKGGTVMKHYSIGKPPTA